MDPKLGSAGGSAEPALPPPGPVYFLKVLFQLQGMHKSLNPASTLHLPCTAQRNPLKAQPGLGKRCWLECRAKRLLQGI
jgi:hypothetical protein